MLLEEDALFGGNVAGDQEFSKLLLHGVQSKEGSHGAQNLKDRLVLGLGKLIVVLENNDEVADKHVLAVGTRDTVDLDKHRVPSAAFDVNQTSNLSDAVSGAETKGRKDQFRVHKVGWRSGRALGVRVLKILSEVVDRLVVFGRNSLASYNVAVSLEEVARGLLRQDVVITFPGDIGKVVLVEQTKAREHAITVATAGTTAVLDSFHSHGGGQALETRGTGMKVGKQVKVTLLHLLLVQVV